MTVSSSRHFDYSYACIYQLYVEDFVVLVLKFTWLVLYHFFVNAFLKCSGSNVVPVLCSWMYQFFSFFPCVIWFVLNRIERIINQQTVLIWAVDIMHLSLIIIFWRNLVHFIYSRTMYRKWNVPSVLICVRWEENAEQWKNPKQI